MCRVPLYEYLTIKLSILPKIDIWAVWIDYSFVLLWKKLCVRGKKKNIFFPSCVGKNPVLPYYVLLSYESPLLLAQNISGQQMCIFPHQAIICNPTRVSYHSSQFWHFLLEKSMTVTSPRDQLCFWTKDCR